MHRRELGRGRLIAALGALVILAACVPLLAWYSLGGDGGELTPLVLDAFDGTGRLPFLAALATLALLTLPYASDRPIAIDRPLAYTLLTVVAFAGLGLWLPQVAGNLAGMTPDRAPGWWLALVGSIVLARGTFEIATEPRRS